MRVILFLKNWTLPVAIAVGTVLYLLFSQVAVLEPAALVLGPVCETLLPVSIFLTLFVTFSKVDFHLMRLRPWHGAVVLAQLVLVVVLTALILSLGALGIADGGVVKLWLEAILICVIAPCASASPVVTAKLGGDLTQMTTFVLLSALVASLLIPAIFPLVEPAHSVGFLRAFGAIMGRLVVVLLLPLALGAVVRHWVEPLRRWIVATPDLGFYLWSVSLAITTGITVKNIVHSASAGVLLGGIALLSLLTSLVQFRVGRLIGRRYGEKVCTGQAMFQKNTGLAIWIAYVYLTPAASIGAGCYVLWQNIINSYELWAKRVEG